MSADQRLQREAQLRAEARSLVEHGELRAAETLYLECEAIGRELGDAEMTDLAICNRAAVRVSLGQAEDAVRQLRAVLVSTRSERNAFIAAHNIGRHYELKKEFKKSLFYSRIALERGARLGDDDWIAAAENQMGNALLATNAIAEAVASYKSAQRRLTPDSPWSAALLTNLGYCDVLAGRIQQGAVLLTRALRLARRLGSQIDEAQARLDLAFAYLEKGTVARARRHADRALAMARRLEWSDGIKNALYLAGEAARLEGGVDDAEVIFGELQTSYYPGQPYLSSLLMAVDVRRMINLHA